MERFQLCMPVGILNAMKRQGGGGEIPNVDACGHTECYEETGWGWRDSKCGCMWAY